MLTRRTTRHLTALSAASLLLLAGCGGSDDTNDAVVPPVTAVATPSETPNATPSDSASPGATESASASPSESASASADEGTVIAINLVSGKPDPQPALNQKFEQGDTVTITVTSDKAYELHVHGYDYSLDVKPGETVKKTFVLDKTGSFVVEVEETGRTVFNLVVQ